MSIQSILSLISPACGRPRINHAHRFWFVSFSPHCLHQLAVADIGRHTLLLNPTCTDVHAPVECNKHITFVGHSASGCTLANLTLPLAAFRAFDFSLINNFISSLVLGPHAGQCSLEHMLTKNAPPPQTSHCTAGRLECFPRCVRLPDCGLQSHVAIWLPICGWPSVVCGALRASGMPASGRTLPLRLESRSRKWAQGVQNKKCVTSWMDADSTRTHNTPAIGLSCFRFTGCKVFLLCVCPVWVGEFERIIICQLKWGVKV